MAFMKRSYFFVLYGLLLATIIITVVNFAYFLEVSSSLGNSFTTHATSQGTLSLFVESNETLPPAPDGTRKRDWIFMVLQWILVPITITIFGAVPGIDAQTRLMFGKYMGFWVTPKHRK